MGLEVRTHKDVEIKFIDDVKKLDPVNLVFGCTGWKGTFKLEIQHKQGALPRLGAKVGSNPLLS